VSSAGGAGAASGTGAVPKSRIVFWVSGFGLAAAVSGNIAVAGADFASNAAGAAYEFVRTGTSWAQKAKFTDPSAAPNDSLGFSVAIAGQTALGGEPHHNNLHGQVDLFPL
jgi:hypothetical protein